MTQDQGICKYASSDGSAGEDFENQECFKPPRTEEIMAHHLNPLQL